MKSSQGFRVRSRQKLRKHPRKKGLPPLTHFFRKFKLGEKVSIKIEPSIHKGMPHPRFHGSHGEVIGIRGKSYLVRIKDKRKPKTLISNAIHLRKV